MPAWIDPDAMTLGNLVFSFMHLIYPPVTMAKNTAKCHSKARNFSHSNSLNCNWTKWGEQEYYLLMLYVAGVP